MAENLLRDEIAYDRLGGYLKALSNPSRLELLYQLRFPKEASEIDLKPRRADKALNPERSMSRQAVAEHLDVLEAIGVVSRDGDAGNGADRFVLNHQRVFAIVEELRKLTLLRPAKPADPLATLEAPSAGTASWEKGPKLVLVAGAYEGRAYALKERALVGRAEGADVRLDYDPFVSSEHAEVTRQGSAWRVASVAGAKNGTFLNFQELRGGDARPIEKGDILGVGRSLLVFRPE